MDYIDYRTLAALVGSWGPILMHQRAAFCLLEAVHAFAEELKAAPRTARALPPQVHDELLLLVLVAPLLWTDVRAPTSDLLYLTDASLERGGVTRCTVPRAAVKALWRFADLRGRHTWLQPLHV